MVFGGKRHVASAIIPLRTRVKHSCRTRRDNDDERVVATARTFSMSVGWPKWIVRVTSVVPSLNTRTRCQVAAGGRHSLVLSARVDQIQLFARQLPIGFFARPRRTCSCCSRATHRHLRVVNDGCVTSHGADAFETLLEEVLLSAEIETSAPLDVGHALAVRGRTFGRTSTCPRPNIPSDRPSCRSRRRRVRASIDRLRVLRFPRANGGTSRVPRRPSPSNAHGRSATNAIAVTHVRLPHAADLRRVLHCLELVDEIVAQLDLFLRRSNERRRPCWSSPTSRRLERRRTLPTMTCTAALHDGDT
jgi:hypothetical protein